jgi:anti-sigma28 factor (negative regulator of flagellin synthesis)
MYQLVGIQMDRQKKSERDESLGQSLGKTSALPANAPSAEGVPLSSEESLTRSRKLARIRKAVADGSYTVSSSKVAGKLIDHMLGR